MITRNRPPCLVRPERKLVYIPAAPTDPTHVLVSSASVSTGSVIVARPLRLRSLVWRLRAPQLPEFRALCHFGWECLLLHPKRSSDRAVGKPRRPHSGTARTAREGRSRSGDPEVRPRPQTAPGPAPGAGDGSKELAAQLKAKRRLVPMTTNAIAREVGVTVDRSDAARVWATAHGLAGRHALQTGCRSLTESAGQRCRGTRYGLPPLDAVRLGAVRRGGGYCVMGMPTNPTKPLLDIMRRSMANLEFIEARKSPTGPYEVTQLINTFLGALVHPFEKMQVGLNSLSLADAANQGWPIPKREFPTYRIQLHSASW